MALLQVEVTGLPREPLDAAARFYGQELARIRADMASHAGHDLVLVFARAGHEHRAWRLASVQELAREFAPRRVNAIAGTEKDAVSRAMSFLDTAPGVTGQLLAVD